MKSFNVNQITDIQEYIREIIPPYVKRKAQGGFPAVMVISDEHCQSCQTVKQAILEIENYRSHLPCCVFVNAGKGVTVRIN